MADNSIRMPSGSGGLVRYTEETGTKYKIKPVHVIAVIIIITIISIALRLFLK